METKKNYLPIICITLAITLALLSSTMATTEEDEKDCADQMTSMASCIPFVSGTAKMPTKECCEDTDKVRTTKPKCLCLLIKESNDPSLGLPINTTLALQMPAACKLEAKVSDCPILLKLPADSPDAKIFKVANADSSSTASAATPDSTASTKSTPDTKTVAAATSSTSNGPKIATSILLVMGLVSITLVFV